MVEAEVVKTATAQVLLARVALGSAAKANAILGHLKSHGVDSKTLETMSAADLKRTLSELPQDPSAKVKACSVTGDVDRDNLDPKITAGSR